MAIDKVGGNTIIPKSATETIRNFAKDIADNTVINKKNDDQANTMKEDNKGVNLDAKA